MGKAVTAARQPDATQPGPRWRAAPLLRALRRLAGREPSPRTGRQGPVAFLITSLMASTLSEPTSGVGFGRGCEGAIVDGPGREGVLRSIPWRKPPQNGDMGSAQPVVHP